MTSPLDTASSRLLWSNVLYIVGAVLTLGTSAQVLFEKRKVGKGGEVKHSVRNEVFFLVSALTCLAGTCGAIYFGGKVSAIKDADLAIYKAAADGKIAQANKDAAVANQIAAQSLRDAGTANQNAAEAKKSSSADLRDKEQILHDNLVLQKQIQDEQSARTAIETKVADRTLSADQQRSIMVALTTQLTRFDQKRVDFVYAPNSSEIENLDIKISECFVGWTGYPFEPTWGMKSGLTVEFDPSNSSAQREANVVVNALRENGLTVNDPIGDLPNQLPEPLIGRPDHRQTDAPLRISIGPK